MSRRRLQALEQLLRMRPQHNHQLTADARREGSAVVVSGTVDLPDDTYLIYEADGGDDWGLILGDRRRGRVVVKDGAFEVRFESAAWAGSVIDVAIGLRGDRHQPKATRDLIGDEGERLMFADVAGHGYAEHVLAFRKDIGPAEARPLSGDIPGHSGTRA